MCWLASFVVVCSVEGGGGVFSFVYIDACSVTFVCALMFVGLLFVELFSVCAYVCPL